MKTNTIGKKYKKYGKYRKDKYWKKNYRKPWKKQKFIRKSRTFNRTSYKRLPKDEKDKRKQRYVRKPNSKKCKCYICGEPNHFAKNCPKRYKPSTNKQIERLNIIEDLEEDIVSINSDDLDVYSIVSNYEYQLEAISSNSDSESDTDVNNLLGQLNQEIGMPSSHDTFFMMECNADTECQHNFQIGLGFDTTRCSYCNWFPAKDKRAQCLLCSITYCIICLEKLNMIHKITLANNREDHSIERIELHLTTREL